MIDRQEIGWKLDTLMAERVMGWKLIHYPNHRVCTEDADYQRAPSHGGYFWKGGTTEEAAVYWTPSDDVTDAMEVAEQIRLQGWDVLMYTMDGDPTDRNWYVEFNRDRCPTITGDALELSLAICRAASAWLQRGAQ